MVFFCHADFNIPFFKIIIESGAYFLSRLKSNSAVYEDIKGKKLIDLHALSQKMAPNDTLRMEVFIGRRKYDPVLLILQKLPAQVIAVKRERAKKLQKLPLLLQKMKLVL